MGFVVWVAFGFGILLIVITVFINFEAMNFISRLLPRNKLPPRPLLVVVMLGVILAHVLEILVFTIGYFLLAERFGLGGFSQEFEPGFMNFFYFSAVCFTTVGMSNFYPTGGLKIISALEALNGFVLITWSASFGYSALGKFWDREK